MQFLCPDGVGDHSFHMVQGFDVLARAELRAIVPMGPEIVDLLLRIKWRFAFDGGWDRGQFSRWS